MSIDIDWERATSGPDGEALAERIRSFVHDKFQQVALPRFIRSVRVTSFEFGDIPPKLEIRDLCDPFSDFYEEDEDDDLSSSSDEPSQSGISTSERSSTGSWQRGDESTVINNCNGIGLRRSFQSDDHTPLPPLRSPMNFGDPLNSSLFSRAGTPGIPGGTSNLSYYYMSLGGISGAQTPLGAVARGSPFPNPAPDSHKGNQQRSSGSHDIDEVRPSVEHDSTGNSKSKHLSSEPSTTTNHSSLNNTNHQENLNDSRHHSPDDQHPNHDPDNPISSTFSLDGQRPQRMREKKPEDFQVFCRVQYAGNIKLSITAEVLLDYPMPSFVGLPLKLNITGFTFDGVAIIAYIRRRVHVCFLSPEDAETLLGAEAEAMDLGEGADSRPRSRGDTGFPTSPRRKHSSLLREIQVESEIGRQEDGKQVLKNVGKVEKFVLERVRRIFEDEFIYPSFWTFLF